MKFPARVILFAASFILLLVALFTTPKVFAQTQTYTAPVNPQNQYLAPNTNPDVPNNLHTFSQNLMIEVMSAALCQLSGIDPTNQSQKCLGYDKKTDKIGFVDHGGGAVGVMGHLISMTFTPPLRSTDYTHYLSQNFGLTKPAYAASGVGFGGISFLTKIWTAFRNVVYIIFVLVFIIIGLAIMLRVKIDPRTVMSIENQLPKLIVGILLVTFSFAIVGVLIDIMYVAMYLMFNLVAGIDPHVAGIVQNLNPSVLQGKSALGGAFGIGDLGGFAHSVASSTTGIIHTMLGIDTNISSFIPVASIFLDAGKAFGIGPGSPHIGNFIVDVISNAAGLAMFFGISHIPNISLFGFTAPVNTILGAVAAVATYEFAEVTLRFLIPYLIVYLIIFIALLSALFRLWFALLAAYLFILLDVVLAPFWIVSGLIPGSKVSFGMWFRDIVANLAVFPVALTMLLLGKIFMDAFANAKNASQFVPPLLGNPGDASAFGALIGIGFIFLTPNVVNMTRSALKAPQFDVKPIAQSIGIGKNTLSKGGADIAGDVFSFTQGNFPHPNEKGATAVLRRLLGKATV